MNDKTFVNSSLWLSCAVFAAALAFFIDDGVFTFFQSVQSLPLVSFFTFFTLLGSGIVIVSILLTVLLVEQHKQAIMPLWLSWMTAFLVTTIIKEIVHRPRPLPATDFFLGATASFPSAHAAVAFALLPVLFSQKLQRWPLFVLAGLVGISRVYLGAHYLSDVLFGAALGYACGLLIVHVFKLQAVKA